MTTEILEKAKDQPGYWITPKGYKSAKGEYPPALGYILYGKKWIVNEKGQSVYVMASQTEEPIPNTTPKAGTLPAIDIIKEKKAEGKSIRVIAGETGVSKSQVARILKG